MQVADLFEEIEHAVESDSLALPSLPDIALRIRKVASDPNCTFGTIGKELKRDASMSTHLIRLANSPLYRTRVAVTNVRSAVHRIGVPAVRNFVTTVVMRNLFRSRNAQLNKVFRDLWNESSEISALTAVLATFCAGYDPDDALLGGLLQDIGGVALLGHLATIGEDLPDEQTIRAAIDELGPRLGELVLSRWQFDERFIAVARARHDWTVDLDPEPALVDVVTLGRAHYYASTGHRPVPKLDSMPAFHKLPVRISETGTIHSLDEAAAEVSVIRSMLRD